MHVFSFVQFGGLKERIDGEESNHFMNTLGESVDISVQADKAATAELLGIDIST